MAIYGKLSVQVSVHKREKVTCASFH